MRRFRPALVIFLFFLVVAASARPARASIPMHHYPPEVSRKSISFHLPTPEEIADAAARFRALGGDPAAVRILAVDADDECLDRICRAWPAAAGLEIRNYHHRVTTLAPLSRLTAIKKLVIDDGAFSTLAPLAKLKSLTSLSLGSACSRDVAVLTALPALRELEITGPHANLDFLKPLTKLERLSLGWMDAADLAPLAALPALTSLSLKCVTPVASQLPSLPALEELTIDGCRIPGPDLAFLTPLARLKRLTLNDLTLTATPIVSLAPVSGLTNLEELEISKCDLASSDLAFLRPLTRLRRLTLTDLPKCQLSVNDADVLGRLTELRLSEFVAPDALDVRLQTQDGRAKVFAIGIDEAALAAICRAWPRLDGLALCRDMNSFPFGDSPAPPAPPLTAATLAPLTNLTRLAIDGGDLARDGLGFLQPLGKLRALTLTRTPLPPLAALVARKELAAIEELTIDDCGAPCRYLAPFATLGELRRLALEKLPGGLPPLDAPGSLSRLERLRLTAAAPKKGAPAPGIDMETVDGRTRIRACAIDDAALAAACRVWPGAASVQIKQSPAVTSLAPLQGLTALKELTIDGCAAPAPGLAFLAPFKKLSRLNCPVTVSGLPPAATKTLRQFTQLNLTIAAPESAPKGDAASPRPTIGVDWFYDIDDDGNVIVDDAPAGGDGDDDDTTGTPLAIAAAHLDDAALRAICQIWPRAAGLTIADSPALSTLAPLAAMKGLIRLKIENSALAPADLAVLGRLGSLQRLAIADPVGSGWESGAAIELKNQGGKVTIAAKRLGEAAQGALCQAWPGAAALTLDQCPDVKALAPLARLTGAKELEIKGIPGKEYWQPTIRLQTGDGLTVKISAGALGDAVVNAVCQTWPQATAIAFDDGVAVTTLAPLAAMQSLTSLTLSGLKPPAPLGLAPLASLAALEELTIAGKDFAPTDLAFLKPLARLRRLKLRKLELATLAPLGAMTGLQELTIDHCPAPAPLALTPLSALTALESLTLNGGQFAPTDLAFLKPLTRLRRLNLDGINLTAGLAPLARLPSLEALSLMWLHAPAPLAPAPLRALTGLKELTIGYSDVAPLDFSLLRPLAQLKRLDLDKTTDGQPSASDAEVLKRLDDLRLTGKTRDGRLALLNMETRESRNGRRRTIEAIGIDAAALAALCEAGATVRELSLHGCPNLAALAPAMAKGAVWELKIAKHGANSHGWSKHVSPRIRITDENGFIKVDAPEATREEMADLCRLCPRAAVMAFTNCRDVAALAPFAAMTNLRRLTLTGRGPADRRAEIRVDGASGRPIIHATRIDDATLAAICETWPQAAAVTISGGGALATLAPLAAMKRLARLTISGLDAQKPLGATTLAALTSLEELTLKGEFDASGKPYHLDLGFLKTLTRLRRLTLEGLGVTGLEPLAALRSLEALELKSLAAPDAAPLALGPLGALTGLEELTLKESPSVGEDVQAFTPRRDAKWEKKLEESPFARGGPATAAFATADLAFLRPCSRLRRLSLDGLTVAGLAPLADLSSLEALELDSLAPPDDEPLALAPLAALKGLKELTLAGDELCIVATDLAFLKPLSQLRRLSLWGVETSDLAPLSGLRSLKALTLAWLDASKPLDPAILGALTGLEELTLEENKYVGDASFIADARLSFLKPLARLRRLSLGNLAVASLAPIAEKRGLVSLKLVDLNAPAPLSPASLAALENLEELQMEIGKAIAPDLAFLGQLTWLKRLTLDGAPGGLPPVWDTQLWQKWLFPGPRGRLRLGGTLPPAAPGTDRAIAEVEVETDDGWAGVNARGIGNADLERLCRFVKGHAYVANFDRPHSGGPIRHLRAARMRLVASPSVTTLSPLKGVEALDHLLINDMPLPDLTPLKGHPGLRRLDLTGAKGAAAAEPLAACPALAEIVAGEDVLPPAAATELAERAAAKGRTLTVTRPQKP